MSPNTRQAQEPGLVDLVAAAIMDVAITHGRVCADDVRALMPNLPRKRSVMGRAFLLLQQEGRLRSLGYEASTHPDNHGRRIKTYAPTHSHYKTQTERRAGAMFA